MVIKDVKRKERQYGTCSAATVMEYALKNKDIKINIHIHTYVIYTHIHINIHAYTNIYIHLYTHTHVLTYKHTNTIYIYIHKTYIHSYIDIYTNTCTVGQKTCNMTLVFRKSSHSTSHWVSRLVFIPSTEESGIDFRKSTRRYLHILSA